MSSYKVITIEGARGKDPELFRRLMAMPEMLEVLMEEDTSYYLATVDGNALSDGGRAEAFLRRLQSVKGVRRVKYLHESS